MHEAVGWDLDSTVCSTMHRRHLIPLIHAGQATWGDYSVLCAQDAPVAGAVALMRLMARTAPEVKHIAISSRSDRALDLTTAWAQSHGVPLSRFMLRPEGDETPNGEWKVRCIRQLAQEGVWVRVFMEDWHETAAYIAEHAEVPVLGVNPFDPGTVLASRDRLAEVLAGHRNCGAECADEIFTGLGGAF